MGELKAPDKPFDISKRAVWEAYEKVRANKGAPGVDKVSLADFEKDLKNNLYKIWNRMSSGSYFPPPVRAVEIPKPHGGGTRTLGVPTVADRIAQTVVAGVLERASEPVFHPDSHGYRPGRSAIDAVRSVPRALLAARLGDRSGHPEVLRQRPVGPDAQGGRRAHRPAVGAVVCAPLVGRTAATTRRHPATTRPRNPTGVRGLTDPREPVPARVPRTPERGWV